MVLVTTITQQLKKLEDTLSQVTLQMQDMTAKFENLLELHSQNVGAREVFPGPLCSWKKEDEKTHCLNHIPHCCPYPFVDILRNTRNFYLIRTEKFENGIRFFFKHCHITYIPTCPYKGKVTIKGKHLHVSHVFYEFTLYLKTFKFTRDGWGSTFQQNLGIADYNWSRFVFGVRWHQNW